MNLMKFSQLPLSVVTDKSRMDGSVLRPFGYLQGYSRDRGYHCRIIRVITVSMFIHGYPWSIAHGATNPWLHASRAYPCRIMHASINIFTDIHTNRRTSIRKSMQRQDKLDPRSYQFNLAESAIGSWHNLPNWETSR